MNAHPHDIPVRSLQDAPFPKPGPNEKSRDALPDAPTRESSKTLCEMTNLLEAIPASQKHPLTRRWWLGPVASAIWHVGILLLAVFGGLFAASQIEPPLTVLGEIALNGLAGPGGMGGDGQQSGASPAIASEPVAGPVGELAQLAEPPAPPAEDPAPAPEPETVTQAPDPKPVLDTALPEPKKKLEPEPKPEPKPKPKHKPKPRHVASRKAAPAQSSDQAKAVSPALATGEGTGQGIGGDGPGKGLGHGNGPPGVGGGPGGGGGGTNIGQFGQGNGPRFRHRSLPRYPDGAKRLNQEGKVCLCLTIDASGVLRNVHVVSHSGLDFVEEALRAIRASTFYPATIKGQPIFSRALLTIRFKLG